MCGVPSVTSSPHDARAWVFAAFRPGGLGAALAGSGSCMLSKFSWSLLPSDARRGTCCGSARPSSLRRGRVADAGVSCTCIICGDTASSAGATTILIAVSPTDCAYPPGWAMTPQGDPLALPHPPSPLASCASPSDPASLSFSKVFRDFRRKKRTPKRAPKGEVVAARMFALLVCARLSACCLCVCAASGCRFVSCLELSRAALCGGADGRGWGTGGLRSG